MFRTQRWPRIDVYVLFHEVDVKMARRNSQGSLTATNPSTPPDSVHEYVPTPEPWQRLLAKRFVTMELPAT